MKGIGLLIIDSTRMFSTLVAAAGLASTAGCGGRQERAASAGHTFRVALLTPGPVSDQSWNSGAFRGLLEIRDSLGAQISNIETKTPAEFDENFRQYGSQGYDLVFGHGFEFQDAARRVAPEFPHTVFVTTSGSTAGLTFGFDDASYLAGVLAGSVTRTNTIGVIGGTELPPVVASFRAFERGARETNPKIRIVSSYVGNWDDVSAGKEQAIAQYSRGVDVIFQNADAAGLGVFQAARERRSVFVIGSNSDQNAVAPEITLGSVVIDLPLAFLAVARDVKAGTFKPRVVELGEASHVVTLVVNPALRARIPAVTLARIDSLQARMLAGQLTISSDSAHPSAVR
jgi:basic membrane lipoprotein Med (substrate-binding protein (PBP1-ABC) superfamily)